MRRLIVLITWVLASQSIAGEEINVLTDLFSPFPPGCVGLSLPESESSLDNLLWDEVVRAPSINSSFMDSWVGVKIWRVGCSDAGYSVVMVRLQNLSETAVLVPQAFVEAGQSQLPFHEAQLITQPAVGAMSASGSILSAAGQTFMLAADPLSIDEETLFSVDEYNQLFTLELSWGSFSPVATEGELFPILPYAPSLDPPQFSFPLLHGRMSGSYSIPGKPYTGLFLNIAEQLTDTPEGPMDSNFLYAVFFTYIDGEPLWVVGNTSGRAPGFDLVELEMLAPEGGQFFANPGAFAKSDVHRRTIGTMKIEALDCNTLLLDYDFSESELGEGLIIANRFIRTAGYDCNPWSPLVYQ